MYAVVPKDYTLIDKRAQACIPRMKQWMLRLLMRALCTRESPLPDCSFEPKTIALWQFGGLGDMLLASPVIRALAAAWPEAEVHVYCSHPQFAGFLRRFANVKGIHTFLVYDFDARTLLHADVRRRLRAIGDDMRAVAPDMLINLHVPAMLDWWAVEWRLVREVNASVTLGFNPRFIERGSLYDVSLNAAARDNTHYTSLYRQLLAQAGIPSDEQTVFPLYDADKQRASALLAEHGLCTDRRWICLHIGGRRLSVEGKMWPVERFAELARRLIDARITPVLIGVWSEREMGDGLCALVAGCVNVIGCTQMEEMAALIALADGFIGHDSGPFHIAAAVGTPCVAICGRPDAEPEYLKYARDNVSVMIRDAPEQITVDDVYHTASEVLHV